MGGATGRRPAASRGGLWCNSRHQERGTLHRGCSEASAGSAVGQLKKTEVLSNDLEGNLVAASKLSVGDKVLDYQNHVVYVK